MQLHRLYPTVLFVLGVAVATSAFTFSFGELTECGDLNITWSGGTPPFHLLITPTYLDVARNISIPSSAYSNGKGSFKTTLPLVKDRQFILTMGDATRENAGGTSNVLTVGEPKSGATCDTSEPSTAFTFSADNALKQCYPFTFADYSRALQPIRILGFIPGGNMIELHPPVNSSRFPWVATLRAGTQMLFVVVDAKNQQGGIEPLQTVGESAATSDCLNSGTLTSTSNAPSGTPTSSSSSASASASSTGISNHDNANDNNSSSISVGAIIGIIAGVLIMIACFVTLGIFCLKRRRTRQAWVPNSMRHSRGMAAVDLLHTPRSGDAPPSAYLSAYSTGGAGGSNSSSGGLMRSYSASSQDAARGASPFGDSTPLPDGYQPQPFMLATPTTAAAGEGGAGATSPRFSHAPSASTSTNTRRAKAAMAGLQAYEPPSRYIIHTDLEDTEPRPNAEGVIELPPQYSERRMPSVALSDAPSRPSVPHDDSGGGGFGLDSDPFASRPSSSRISDDVEVGRQRGPHPLSDSSP